MNLRREIRMTECFIIVLNVVAADGDGINATAQSYARLCYDDNAIR